VVCEGNIRIKTVLLTYGECIESLGDVDKQAINEFLRVEQDLWTCIVGLVFKVCVHEKLMNLCYVDTSNLKYECTSSSIINRMYAH
jgi:hypothetical protein